MTDQAQQHQQMIDACQQGDAATVQTLSDNGFPWTQPLHWTDKDGVELDTPAIFIAIDYRQTEVVKILLLQPNANPNILDANEYSPLTWASMHGNLELVELLLLEHGAKVDQDAVDMAQENGHTDILSLLRSKFDLYADIDENDVDEIMIKASREGDVPKVQQLIREGYDFDKWKITTEDGETQYSQYSPIFFAMKNGHIEVIREFLQAGVEAQLEETHFHYDDDTAGIPEGDEAKDDDNAPQLTEEQMEAIAQQMLAEAEEEDKAAAS